MMISAIVISVLFCSFYHPGHTAKIILQDDKTNWKAIMKAISKSSGARSDDSVLPVFDRILRVNARERGKGPSRSGSSDFLFQGDISMSKTEVVNLLSAGTTRRKRAVMRKTSTNLWTGGISYVLHRSIRGRAISAIRSAIKEWETTLTCMRKWRDVTNTPKPRDYIYFFRGRGCYSQVGRRGGLQKVSIGNGCEYRGIAIHEIGHALGFWHEQSRPDRDQYVTIYWNNIIPAMKFNFRKYSVSRIDSLGVPYDYGSVMHYGATSFSKDGRSITIHANGKKIGQRYGLSNSDKKQAQKLYGCTGTKCTDRVRHCTFWGKNGYCTNSQYRSYMKKYCCKTCQNSTNCTDQHSYCQSWATSGYCKGRYEKFMNKNCCKACRSRSRT